MRVLLHARFSSSKNTSGVGIGTFGVGVKAILLYVENRGTWYCFQCIRETLIPSYLGSHAKAVDPEFGGIARVTTR